MNDISKLAKLIRYYSLISTTEAGSGHPSSSLSAADLTAVLMFGSFFKFDLDHPEFENNDRLIFSKGHASPLFYSLYAAAGKVSKEELMSLRKFGSKLEGHPTLEFKYTEVPTGSLGQGLSVGVGMALNAKLDKLSYRTYVLMGDSEVAEGSIWEAAASAFHYHLDNLIGILDVNRLGQRGETMLGHDVETYQKRFEAFGWRTMVVDGHNLEEIKAAFGKAISRQQAVAGPDRSVGEDSRPTIIIAKTLKGKGVSFVEDKDNWHGKALSKEELEKALRELGEVDKSIIGEIAKPEKVESEKLRVKSEIKLTAYDLIKPVATRKAYGNVLPALMETFPNIVVLDAETSNSTYAETAKKKNPERFFEMYIAEQNMAGVALGFSRRGKIPFVSTFAAFLTRAFDQIRMSQYADANIKFIGSHAGVSIGEDGASQMGLEEIAMFRTLLDAVVLYPSDAVSAEKLIYEAAKHPGNVYIQTTRKETPILYSGLGSVDSDQSGMVKHEFKIGGSCVLRSSEKDLATVVGAGITLHEALAAYEELQKEKINIRVIDLYSIKPLDVETLIKAAKETKAIITVEDNHIEGGIGEAVAAVVSGQCTVVSLAVKKMPHSGKPEELIAYEEIGKDAIIKAVKKVVR